MASCIESFHRSTVDMFGSEQTTEPISDRVRSFLPAVASGDKNTAIQRISVTTFPSPNGAVYKYCVEWVEPTKTTQHRWLSKFGDATSTVTSPCYNSRLTQRSTSRINSLGVVQCDGPCQNNVPLSSVVQFGCDHLICDGCMRSQMSAPLFDGSPGCCNLKCVELARINGEKLRCGKTKSGVPSLISISGTWESLQIHISILKKMYKNVVRTTLEYEFGSQLRVSLLAKTLYNYVDVLKDSRVYYSTRRPQSRNDLKPIALLETNLRFYDLIDDTQSYTTDIYFIIAGKGIRV